MRSINNDSVEDQTEKYCWDCHRETPHGRVHSLSSTPYARGLPHPESVIPLWLHEFVSSEKIVQRTPTEKRKLIRGNKMKSIQELTKNKPWLGWLLFVVTVVVVFLIGLFASSIIERRDEAFRFNRLNQLQIGNRETKYGGENYPREYETYMQMHDTTFASKYAGSVNKDYLQETPELVVMWAGYAFSKEYNAPGDTHLQLKTSEIFYAQVEIKLIRSPHLLEL